MGVFLLVIQLLLCHLLGLSRLVSIQRLSFDLLDLKLALMIVANFCC